MGSEVVATFAAGALPKRCPLFGRTRASNADSLAGPHLRQPPFHGMVEETAGIRRRVDA